MLDHEELIKGRVKALEGDWQHKCLGRSTPARLKRAIAQADEAGLKVTKLRKFSLGKLLNHRDAPPNLFTPGDE